MNTARTLICVLAIIKASLMDIWQWYRNFFFSRDHTHDKYFIFSRLKLLFSFSVSQLLSFVLINSLFIARFEKKIESHFRDNSIIHHFQQNNHLEKIVRSWNWSIENIVCSMLFRISTIECVVERAIRITFTVDEIDHTVWYSQMTSNYGMQNTINGHMYTYIICIL